jgi:uncharacterized membrane protein
MTTEPFVMGTLAAILAMAAVTYLCRISGYGLMGFVPLTPAVRRGLAALPGSIVLATLVPLIEKSGLAAAVAIVAAVIAMILTRREFVALIVGLAVVAGLRAYEL